MRLSKEKVQVCMARSEMSVKKLAVEYGCTTQFINSLFLRRSVRPSTAGRIAKALGVDVTEIIED